MVCRGVSGRNQSHLVNKFSMPLSAMNSAQTVKAPNVSRSVLLKISLLTLFFGGLYFVLRALPDAQCGFLHYEEIIYPDGTVEYCATNHAGFLDLTQLKYPVDMNLSIEGLSTENTEQAVTLELLTPGGMPIAPHELAITHTEKMHVMLIDPSLVDYHHVHPQPDGISGKYTFKFTPKQAGIYTVFAEIVPLRTRRQVIASGTIKIEGAEGNIRFEHQTESNVDGVYFTLKGVPQTLKTGIDYRFDLDVLDAAGDTVAFELIMGAKGHMVAFDAERKGFAHMHPIDSVLRERSVGSDSELAFLFNVPNSGWYRLFAQIQLGGREIFGSFDLKVE